MKNEIRPALTLSALLLLAVAGCGEKADNSDAAASNVSVRDMTSDERLALPANVANGERLFLACAVCHDARADVGHRIGPNLWEIYESPAARHGDFAYSKGLREAGIIWDDQSLDAYIENPLALVPRGRMAYAGEKDPANRRDLVEYLKSLK